MRKNKCLVVTLSLSLGVGLLAGCGKTPAAPTTVAPVMPAPAVQPQPERAPVAPAPEVKAPEAKAAATQPTGESKTPANPPIAAQVGMIGDPNGLMPGGLGVPAGAIATGLTGTGLDGTLGAATVLGPTTVVQTGVVTPALGVVGGVAPVIPFGPEGANGLVVFQSDRATGGGAGFDIFVYDAVAATVLALPGVNSFADETNPRLSSNGNWLIYQSNESGDNDVLLFSLRSQLINTLAILNTDANEEQPDVSDDGTTIVYVSDQTGQEELRIYDLVNGDNYRVPVANRGLSDINWPTISGNGEVIAYGASPGFHVLGGTPAPFLQDSDIFVYSLRDAAQLTPPFINTSAGEYNPDLSLSGEQILFVSNRRGSEDIYAVDLLSGFTDNLVLANSDFTEQEPRWLGGGNEAVVFHSDRSGEFRIFAYDLGTALLNTLPVAHEIGSNTLLRDVNPSL